MTQYLFPVAYGRLRPLPLTIPHTGTPIRIPRTLMKPVIGWCNSDMFDVASTDLSHLNPLMHAFLLSSFLKRGWAAHHANSHAHSRTDFLCALKHARTQVMRDYGFVVPGNPNDRIKLPDQDQLPPLYGASVMESVRTGPRNAIHWYHQLH